MRTPVCLSDFRSYHFERAAINIKSVAAKILHDTFVNGETHLAHENCANYPIVMIVSFIRLVYDLFPFNLERRKDEEKMVR